MGALNMDFLRAGITFAVGDTIYADDGRGGRDALYGQFAYSSFGVVTGGVLDHILENTGGFKHYDVSGFSVSASAFVSAIHNGDPLGAFAAVLSGNDSISGTAFDDVLMGFDGADTISGGGGFDSLYGGNGDDLLIVGPGNSLLDGGLGLDTASFVNATRGVNVSLLLSGPQDTGQGVETLVSVEKILGSTFNDTLAGDDGANTITGGGGADQLAGKGGDDILVVGEGASTVDGGGGSDTISFLNVSGGVRYSLALQGAAQDTGHGVMLTTNLESVTGSAFGDTLIGDDNANVIIGGGGADNVSAQGGDDVIIVGDGANTVDGGIGVDTLSFQNASGGIKFSLGLQGASQDTGHGVVVASNLENVTGSASNDVIGGDDGANTIIGGGGADNLSGQGGDDLIAIGDGASTVDGGTGTDTLAFQNVSGGVRFSLALQGAVQDTGHGAILTTGLENVTGGGFNDTLAGDDGANIVIGGGGVDNISAQGGDDLIVIGNGANTVDGGSGLDTLVFQNVSGGVRYSLALQGAAQDTGHGAMLTSNLENVTGSAFNDTLAAADAPSVLRGGDGNDSIAGGADFDNLNGNAGDDVISGGFGNDWVLGGKGNDALSGDYGNDFINGNLGNDTLAGGAGADTVLGGQGNDVLVGGDGNDYLSGDLGADTLTGGLGADTFHTFGGTGIDLIKDFDPSEGDHLLLDAGTTYTLTQSGSDVLVDMTGGGEAILVGVTLASLPAGWISS